MHDNASKDDDSADDARLCLTTSYFESNYANTSQKSEEHVTSPDDMMVTADELRAEVCENKTLSPHQEDELPPSHVFMPPSTSHLSATSFFHLIANFLDSCTAHPNPLDGSVGNYSLADLHRQYKKYIHKRPKHLLL